MNPDLPRSPAGGFNPWMIAVMLSIAPFMEVLDTTIANVSLPHIAGSLGCSQQESTWVITSYLVSNSIVLPISGWLAQLLGRKNFYQLCVVLFTAASVLCAVSTSLDMIVIARVLQGIGGGGLAPVAQGMLADSFPPQKRGPVFALFGISIMVAPAVGPVAGGWITDNLTWHWVFLINLPVGLVALALTATFLSEPPLLVRERKELLAHGAGIDYVGLALVAVGFGTMQVFFDKFELEDGFSSPVIVALFAICVTSLSTLVVWEWGHPRPVMNFRLFKIPNFSICTGAMLLNGFVLMSSTQLLPQMTQTLFGYDARTAGMVLAMAGLVMLCVMPIAGMLVAHVPERYLMMTTFIGVGISMNLQTLLTPDATFHDLVLARISQVAFLPFLFVSLSTASYVGVPAKNNGEAAALINQARNIGGGAGISFVTTLLAWREQFHHERFAESVTAYGGMHGLTLAQLAGIVQHQASFVSYLDVFRVVGTLALVVSPIVLFLRSTPRPGPQKEL